MRDALLAAWEAPQRTLAPMLGTPGYTLPSFAGLEWRELGESCGNTERLVVRVGKGAKNNWLLCPPGYPRAGRITIVLANGVVGNILIFGAKANIWGEFHFNANGSLAILGDDAWHASHVEFRSWSHRQLFFFGRKSTSNGLHVIMQGVEKRVVIGDDCMFANGIYVRNSDMHAVIDMRNGNHLNPSGNIHIEPHVWVAQEALILRNTHVGFGSIVGAKAILNNDVPRFSSAAGAPARV